MTRDKIKVLIVDDSALIRKVLTDALSADPDLEVVGAAHDPYMARDMIVKLRPQVLTLDVEMPRMDGVEFLRKLMKQYPLPVIMVSSLTQTGKQITLDALDAGAVDFISKPTSNVDDSLRSMIADLRQKIKLASIANLSHFKSRIEAAKAQQQNQVAEAASSTHYALSETTYKLIAIGASTGGTEALKRVLEMFPSTVPGIVVVQHMPPGFTKLYAQRLNESCKLRVVEGSTGELVTPGKVIIAPGGTQMKVKRIGGNYQIDCSGEEKVNGHCPSVSVLFDSVAQYVGKNAVGVMLTGMGGDGGDEMKKMKDAGSFNIAQDEATSVIFGMPRVAIEKGGVDEILPLNSIADRIVRYLKEQK